MIKKYFGGSIAFALAAIALSGGIGFMYGGITTAMQYMFAAFMLGVLETCVSFDNAIVNATVLKDMDDKWRHRFLTWGMAIAVFGMRLVFPIAIVSIATGAHSVINWDHIGAVFNGAAWVELFKGTSVYMALFDPQAYQAAITSAHTQIMAFGGIFLLMVFLKFFIDAEKDHHWIGFIEKHFVTIGKIESIQAAVAIVTLLIVSPFMHEPTHFFTAGLVGLVAYILVDGIGAFLGDDNAAAKTGLGAFIYLEVVDASFSFDGVIAAFAITNNFLIIALGLGIGAMFVRSLTLYMVDKEALDELAYLEHGAFYAIGFLVAVMFLSAAGIELGEVVTAGGSLVIISIAAIHSLKVRNKGEPVKYEAGTLT
jgi:hypothetical protein